MCCPFGLHPCPLITWTGPVIAQVKSTSIKWGLKTENIYWGINGIYIFIYGGEEHWTHLFYCIEKKTCVLSMWYKNVWCCVGCYHMSFRSNELARYLFCPSEMNHVNTQTTDRRINKFITHGQRGLDDDRLLLSLNFSPRILKSRHQSSVHLTPFFLSSLTLIGKTLILIVYLYTTQDNFCNSTDILLDCDTKVHGSFGSLLPSAWTGLQSNRRYLLVSLWVFFTLYFANPRIWKRWWILCLIIIDLSNQLSEAQKVLEKQANCDDYDAGIVQTLLPADWLVTCSRNFSISPLLQVSGFCCGWRGMWRHGVMQHREAGLRSREEDYRGNATPNYFLTLSRLWLQPAGAIFTSHITQPIVSSERRSNRGNVTPWSDLIWINSPVSLRLCIHSTVGDMNVSGRGIA